MFLNDRSIRSIQVGAFLFFFSLTQSVKQTGNQKGHLQVYNMSTGKCVKDGISKGTIPIKCLEFDSSGTLLWTGDEKVEFCFCF